MVQNEPQHLIHLKANLQEKRMPRYQSLVRWSWRLIIGTVVAVLGLFLIISFTAIPSFRELEAPNSALASDVLDANGGVLGRYFVENRVPVSYEELNPWLVKALVANEDERYWNHAGVDARAVARVMFRTILMRDQSAGGGSTITQQLAKMLYSDRNFKDMNAVEKAFALIYRKLREWITAIKLERSYTKEEIIAMYLNQFNFINNAYGIQAASEVYFGKSQDKLKIEEAAMLIGMLQNPSFYNPVRFPERSIKRRWTVLYQMTKNGYLTEAQFDALKVSKLDMSKFKKVTFSDDKAPYLCAELKKDVVRLLELPEARKADGTKYNIYKDGLKIYTTIDPIYQRYAEEAMVENMKKLQKRFFEVWRGKDPWTYEPRSRKATQEEMEMRREGLEALIREGDRYQQLRPKFFTEIEDRIRSAYNFELRDVDIERMLKEEKKSGTITKMVSRREVSPDQAAAYRRIMGSPDWAEIKTQWRALQAATKKLYATKTKMKVFTWNGPRLEKDTVMSPLDSIRYHRMFLQTGVLAVDPLSSEIKAWVGGINFKYFQYDHIRTMRQVGSTFKPFVYATAIAQQGVSPCMEVYDVATTIPKRYQNFTNIVDWTPKNSTNVYTGQRMTLKEALKGSVNSISTFLMKQLGDTDPVRGLVHNMGIDSSARLPNGQYRIPREAAIALGAADLTVLEMTGAYATFANNGTFARPYVIKKIEDKNGRVIYRSLPEERVALPPNASYVMLQMLKYNVAGAPGISGLKSEVGGKTGTTTDQTDGWFMGVTPRLVVGTWVGGEDRWIRFLSLSDGQGARMARPIFAGFMQRLEKDRGSGYNFNARFKRPAGDLGIELNCASYQDSIPGGGDEEDFSPDIYNDEIDNTPPATTPSTTLGTPLPSTAKPGASKPATPAKPADPKTKARKPDDSFGDEN
jgi:penicillin-binding protein 1A